MHKSRVLLRLRTDPHRRLVTSASIIEAASYSYLDGGDQVGTEAKCDDGSWRTYAINAHPTNREFFGITPGGAENDMSYEELRRAVIAASGWPGEGYSRWAEFDANGDLIPESDTEARFRAWLDSPIDGWDVEGWLECGLRRCSQYAAGLDLLNLLPPAAVRRLKIREGDIGGMAGPVECALTEADIETLNDVLACLHLPYVFVECECSD